MLSVLAPFFLIACAGRPAPDVPVGFAPPARPAGEPVSDASPSPEADDSLLLRIEILDQLDRIAQSREVRIVPGGIELRGARTIVLQGVEAEAFRRVIERLDWSSLSDEPSSSPEHRYTFRRGDGTLAMQSTYLLSDPLDELRQIMHAMESIHARGTEQIGTGCAKNEFRENCAPHPDGFAVCVQTCAQPRPAGDTCRAHWECESASCQGRLTDERFRFECAPRTT